MQTVLANVLSVLGDSRQEAEMISEALALLEAQPPGHELVAAYAQLAGTRAVGGAYLEAIAAAERSLALAAELGMPEPAKALGYRAYARSALGERQGVEDMRRALQLAIEQGQGGAAAILHNNLAMVSWQYDGPQVALAACREGVDFCERRGIVETARAIAAMSTTFIAACGLSEQALAEAEAPAERLQASGNISFLEVRSVQLHLLAERGAHEPVRALDRAHSHSPRDRPAVSVRAGVCVPRHDCCSRKVARWKRRRCCVELDDVDGHPGRFLLRARLPGSCAPRSPSRIASSPPGSWPASSRVTPLPSMRSPPSRAQLAEAAGDHAEAVTLYAEAAERWRKFGNVPEHAYALLGQGRCLAALGEPEARGAAARGARAIRLDGLQAGARRDGRAPGANDRSGLVSTTHSVTGS